MKILILIILDLLLLCLVAQCQTLTGIETPKPKADTEVCKGTTIGAVCPASGRRYFGDPLRFDAREDSTWKAVRSPGMLISETLLIAMTIADIETTQHCQANHTCREGNPLMGQSRAQKYAVGMSVNAITIMLGAKAKRQGHGITAFCAEYGGAAMHGLLAARNR